MKQLELFERDTAVNRNTDLSVDTILGQALRLCVQFNADQTDWRFDAVLRLLMALTRRVKELEKNAGTNPTNQ